MQSAVQKAQRVNWNEKIILLFFAALFCFGLASCNAEQPVIEETPVVETTPSEQLQSPAPEITPKEEPTPSGSPEPEQGDLEFDFSYEDIQNHEFYFSSGAGAWATILHIHADGSFDGEYYDSDMGTSGPDYPNGTQYYCAFEGQFAQLVKVNEYTCATTIDSIQFANEVGTEEIKEGIRYVYSQAHGLQNTDRILFYLPGAPLDKLPEGYLSWVGYPDLTMTTDIELPFYGLYNENDQTGFSGYERIVPPEEPIEEPTKEPDADSEDTQAVLDYLDNLFAGGRVALWGHLLPGTGPISASLDGYYAQVREVFASYNWTQAEETPLNMPYTADIWELWLVDNYTCKVDVWSNSNRVVFGFNAVDGSEKATEYCYDGEPGSLNAALVNLWGGPEFRYALVLLPVEGQDDRTLMETYETKFRELYLDSGAINDYELRELELIPVGEVIGGSQNPFFLMNYSVKPSDLSALCWRNYTVSEDGWVDISVEVNLSLMGYENSETVWRCAFWQPPNDKY